MGHPRATIALILGKQGSGKTTRVLTPLRRRLEQDVRAHPALEKVNIGGNYFNHLAWDDDGDLAFVGGIHLGKAWLKVSALEGLYALELPHSGYLPAGADRDLNNERIRTRIFHLELPEPLWRSFGGSTGAITSPEHFMAHGRKVEARADCDYQGDLARIRSDIECSGVPVVRFDNPDAMIEPIRDFLLFSADGEWSEAQLRSFIALKMGKTRSRGHEGKTGLLGYQVVDFGNGIRSDGDTLTIEKLGFIVEAARLPVRDRTFLDLGCNMGSVIFELKKKGAGRCIGFDVYDPALEIARTLNRNWFQFPDLSFLHQSIVDDWSASLSSCLGAGVKVDHALALSVLHKDGVRDRLEDVVRNLARSARQVVVEAPLEPAGDTNAPDWDYARLRKLLAGSFAVEELPRTDFHSASGPRALLVCRQR